MDHIDADQLKASINIVDFIGRLVELQKTGPKEFVGLCPFHKERTPSFTVNSEKQLYYCFGCQANGDVFNFIEHHEGIPFNEAVGRVAELAGSLPLPKPTKTHGRATCAKKPAINPLAKVVKVYHYTDEAGTLLYEVHRWEPGRQVGRKKDFTYHRPDGNGGFVSNIEGVRRVLYRLPKVVAADTVWLCEGEKDVQTLEALGLTATTPSGGAQKEWQPEYTETLAGKTVIVIPDNDDPGRKHGNEIELALTGHAADVIQVVLPEGKDVTEYIARGYTLVDLELLLADAKTTRRRDELEQRGLLSVDEILEVDEDFLNPKQHGILTGFTRLDDMTLGMQPGELWILAARPACGKTSLALNIGRYVAKHDKSVAVFSLEMSRKSLLTRLVCGGAKADTMRFRAGKLFDDERANVRRELNELRRLPLFIDDYSGATFKQVREKAIRLRERHGVDLLIVDYLQLMNAETKESRNQEINALSRGLKLLARELKIPVLALSQLSRAVEKREGNHKPQLSDLRDSGGIEQDADVVVFIHREFLYKPDDLSLKTLADLLLAKNRQGPLGRVELNFFAEHTLFTDRTNEEQPHGV